jgi:hypothetical protein
MMMAAAILMGIDKREARFSDLCPVHSESTQTYKRDGYLNPPSADLFEKQGIEHVLSAMYAPQIRVLVIQGKSGSSISQKAVTKARGDLVMLSEASIRVLTNGEVCAADFDVAGSASDKWKPTIALFPDPLNPSGLRAVIFLFVPSTVAMQFGGYTEREKALRQWERAIMFVRTVTGQKGPVDLTTMRSQMPRGTSADARLLQQQLAGMSSEEVRSMSQRAHDAAVQSGLYQLAA